jgi:hypothetical protein
MPHIWVQPPFADDGLSAILPAPALTGPSFMPPAFGHRRDAVLEQVSHGQPEEIGDFS